MSMKIKDGKPIAKIGFQVISSNVYDIAGYCAAEMAIEEANREKDFPVNIELVPVVDERNPEIARRLALQFVEDPLSIGILGPRNSDMVLTTQDIYNSANLVQLTSEASNPSLTSKGYKNFFRLVANDEYQGRDLAKVAVSYLKAERIVVLHDSTAWGKAIAEIFSEQAKRLGSDPVLFHGFGEDELKLDFEKMVKDVIDSDPDLVYFAIYWHKAHIIAHKLRYRGLKATFLGSDALKPFAFLEVPSFDVVKPYHTLAGVDMLIKPSARKFFIQFAAKYPLMLIAPQYAAEAFDCASLLLEAIRRAGEPNRNKILEEMQSIENFEGAIGLINFEDNGDLIDPEIGLYQCVDGLRKYIGAVKDVVT